MKYGSQNCLSGRRNVNYKGTTARQAEHTMLKAKWGGDGKMGARDWADLSG